MTRIHAHDGALIAEYARERRIFVPINTIPKRVIAAFLSAEDKRFYEHGGLDFTGIAPRRLQNRRTKIQGNDRRAEGASTITQQVAKNFLLSSERTLERKIKEAILAIRIERAYSKDKILELYLNEIYLGIGSYGVAAAALNYFNKELQRPHASRRSPISPRCPRRPTTIIRSADARRRPSGATGSSTRWPRTATSRREEAEAAKAKPLDGQHPPVRRAHLRRRLLRRGSAAHAVCFGETAYGESEKLVSTAACRCARRSIRSCSSMARRALIDGLVALRPRARAGAGPVQKHRHRRRLGRGARRGIESRRATSQPWRLGVVLEVQKRQGRRRACGPRKQQDGSSRRRARGGRDHLRRGEVGEVARARRPRPRP